MNPFASLTPPIVIGSTKEGYVHYKLGGKHLNTGFAGNSFVFPRAGPLFPRRTWIRGFYVAGQHYTGHMKTGASLEAPCERHDAAQARQK